MRKNIVAKLLGVLWLLWWSGWMWSLQAKVVTPERAKTVAEQFFNANRPQTRANEKVSMKLVWDGTGKATRAGEDPAFFVYANTQGPGFVVVSGDEAARPILGYSFNTVCNSQNLPVAFVEWMKGMAKQVTWARQQGLKSQWGQATRAGQQVVLLQTANWDQGIPYNLYCPMDGDKPSVTGCVATALAIVMRYYKWPAKGIGETEEYVTKSSQLKVPARDLASHTYDWDKMPLDVNASTSAASIQQIATLMADLGAVQNMDYSAEGSGTILQLDVMSQHFGYSVNATVEFADFYGLTKWQSKLNAELDAKRPVLYRGSDKSEGGHQFILDGYNTDGSYHVNWGWSGGANGNYFLSALGPEIFNFELDQGAIFGFQPAQKNEEVKDYLCLSGDGLVINETRFEKNQPFTVNDLACMNMSSAIFQGYVFLVLKDKKDKVKEILFGGKVKDLVTYMVCYWTNLPCTITTDIEEGDYICVMYMYEDWSEPKDIVCGDGDGIVSRVYVAGSPEPEGDRIKDHTSLVFDKEARTFVITTLEGVGFSLLSPGGSSVGGDTYQVKGKTITIDATKLNEGAYTVKLSKGKDVKEFKLSLSGM